MPLNSIKTYIGNAATTDFLFDIPRINDSDVLGFVDDLVVPGGIIDPTTFRFNSAPPAGSIIQIRRLTNSITARHTFPDGTYIRSSNIDGNSEQMLFLHQEQEDRLGTGTGSGGATTLVELLDTPSDYSGQAGKLLAVAAGETGTEFVDPNAAGDVDGGIF